MCNLARVFVAVVGELWGRRRGQAAAICPRYSSVANVAAGAAPPTAPPALQPHSLPRTPAACQPRQHTPPALPQASLPAAAAAAPTSACSAPRKPWARPPACPPRPRARWCLPWTTAPSRVRAGSGGAPHAPDRPPPRPPRGPGGAPQAAGGSGAWGGARRSPPPNRAAARAFAGISPRRLAPLLRSARAADTVTWAARTFLNKGQEVHLVQARAAPRCRGAAPRSRRPPRSLRLRLARRSPRPPVAPPAPCQPRPRRRPPKVLDASLASQAVEQTGEGGLHVRGVAAEADPASIEASRAYLAKLRDSVLAQGGVKPANVKIVPLPSNTATCARGGAPGRGGAGARRAARAAPCGMRPCGRPTPCCLPASLTPPACLQPCRSRRRGPHHQRICGHLQGGCGGDWVARAGRLPPPHAGPGGPGLRLRLRGALAGGGARGPCTGAGAGKLQGSCLQGAGPRRGGRQPQGAMAAPLHRCAHRACPRPPPAPQAHHAPCTVFIHRA